MPTANMATGKTRKEELSRIRTKKKVKWKNILKNFQNADDEPMMLTTAQFILIAGLHHLNSENILNFLSNVLNHDPISACVMYVCLVSVLGVPMSMLVNFMSSYSGRSYLKFWDSVPLFQGLGYTLGMLRMSTEIFSIVNAATALVYVWKVQTPGYKDKVTSCAFEEPEQYYDEEYEEYFEITACKQHQTDYIETNCTEDGLITATQYYHEEVIMKQSTLTNYYTPTVSMEHMWAALFSWTLVFVISVMGLRRIKRLALNVQIFFTLSMFVLCVVTLFMVDIGEIDNSLQYTNPLSEFDFWLGMIFHAAEINILSNMIWLGTMKPAALHPKFAALIIPPIKTVVLIFLMGTMSVVRTDHAFYYSFSDVDCLKLTYSSALLFWLIPDVLLRHETWRITLTWWYLSIFAFTALSTVYSTIAVLDAFEEKFYKLKKYRIITCFFICAIGFALTMPFVTNASLFYTIMWKYFGYNVTVSAIMLFVNLSIFFVYTTDQIISDYTFAFGNPPEKFWTTLWRCCPMFAIFGFLFALKFQFQNLPKEGEVLWIIRSTYIYSAIVLSPIIVVAIVQFCKHVKTRSLQKLIESTDDWGPKDEKKREARRNFYPQRNVRFRVDRLVCKHNCSIANGDTYKAEILLQRRKLAIFEKKYGHLIT